MKKLSSILMIAFATLALQACNNRGKNAGSSTDSSSTSASSTTTDSSATKKDTGKTTASTSTPVDKGDASFAMDAANGGMAEVEMGKMAQQKGVSARVKSFGAMMVNDHSKANQELMGIAKSKNITLPASPTGDEQKNMGDIMKKSGKDFDKAYVNGMVDDHKKDVKKFEDAAKNLKDPDLKAFATKTLPVLKTHLDSITAIQKSMK